MPGRPRLPAADKKAKGTFQKCRNPQDEVKYSVAKKKPSPDSLNSFGKWLWDTLSEKLIESGVLTEVDYPAFEMMCIRYGQFREIQDEVRKNYTANIENEKGQVTGLIRQMNADQEACFHLMQEFGLGPVSRNKFGIRKKDEPTEDQKKMRELLGG